MKLPLTWPKVASNKPVRPVFVCEPETWLTTFHRIARHFDRHDGSGALLLPESETLPIYERTLQSSYKTRPRYTAKQAELQRLTTRSTTSRVWRNLAIVGGVTRRAGAHTRRKLIGMKRKKRFWNASILNYIAICEMAIKRQTNEAFTRPSKPKASQPSTSQRPQPLSWGPWEVEVWGCSKEVKAKAWAMDEEEEALDMLLWKRSHPLPFQKEPDPHRSCPPRRQKNLGMNSGIVGQCNFGREACTFGRHNDFNLNVVFGQASDVSDQIHQRGDGGLIRRSAGKGQQDDGGRVGANGGSRRGIESGGGAIQRPRNGGARGCDIKVEEA